jgi:hypothetical protein
VRTKNVNRDKTTEGKLCIVIHCREKVCESTRRWEIDSLVENRLFEGCKFEMKELVQVVDVLRLLRNV